MGFWRFGSFCNIKSLFFKGLRVRHSAKLRGGSFGKVTGGIRQSYGGYSAKLRGGVILCGGIFPQALGAVFAPSCFRHLSRQAAFLLSAFLPLSIARHLPQIAASCCQLSAATPTPCPFSFRPLRPRFTGGKSPRPLLPILHGFKLPPLPPAVFLSPCSPPVQADFPGFVPGSIALAVLWASVALSALLVRLPIKR